MSNKWLKSLKVLICMLLILAFAKQSIFAKEADVNVYFNGKKIQFNETQPVIIDGSTLVPFRTLFETLGFEVKWNNSERKAIGEKDGLRIELTIDGAYAQVNGNDVNLTAYAQIINEKTMVPLRFISENSGFKVSYSNKGDVFKIEISSDGNIGRTNSASEESEPYLVKGRAVDAKGNPLKGVKVTVRNQLKLYDSIAQAVTDVDGRYQIPLGIPKATWTVSAQYIHDYNGKTYKLWLSNDDSPFASEDGAIRDLTMTSSGEGCVACGFVFFNVVPENRYELPPADQKENVELTLTPDGLQFDGSIGGASITARAAYTATGFGIKDIPLGRYKATARYLPPGETAQTMLIRNWKYEKVNEFAPSVIAEFDSDLDSGVPPKMKLDVKLPVTNTK
ncbi:stalk domain-containing protein [Paenibacillus sp. GP183]|uniref:stalk domain-containing protein n=1 Tax=Paenibacillus sp. GP183 TaxID=1882751 RepID=UPI00089CA530|nr:stalk domain-containing protein [Paenibacillus sp. GP183]SEB86858.1 Copper amine oxidase N-terminal domain-containing protein [Paenibacillus sp. GP183]